MTEHQRVELTINELGIAEVKLNRPDKLNALDMPMFKALSNVIKQLKNNKQVKAVIVHGAGDDFCSGLDVKSVMSSASNAFQLLFKWWPGKANLAQRVSSHWRKLPFPVIVAIHGRCWGGGTQIALGADFRIASPDADISIMESKWGLIPDMAGNKPLSQIMPLDQAMKLAMTAEQLSGEQALSLGLVTEVAEQPLEAARAFANQLLSTSPDVLAAIKKLYTHNWHRDESTLLRKESGYQIKILSGKNQRIATKKAMGKDAEYIKRKNW